MKDWYLLIARICVSFYLVASALALIIGFDGVKFYLTINKITNPIPFVLFAISFVSISSLLLLAGYKIKIAASMYIIYLIVLFFLSPPNFQNPMVVLNFTKNISIFGGIFYLYICPAGRYSLDNYFKRKNS